MKAILEVLGQDVEGMHPERVVSPIPYRSFVASYELLQSESWNECMNESRWSALKLLQ